MLNQEQAAAVAQAWEICEMQAILGISPDEDCAASNEGCINTYEFLGPLMTTTWGQRKPYNDSVRFEGCPTAGTAPTGCVATAMAQVMKFHEFPANYNWANMPDNTGTTETATLMRDIGEAVDMQYSCGGSGAYMNDAASAFSNDFGYQNANYSGFNRDEVIQQIRWNRPVLLSVLE